MPVITELAYQPDSSLLFETFAAHPWAVFLDSAWPHNQCGRYDIISAAPVATLVTIGQTTRISNGNSIRESKRDPFCLLRETLQEHGGNGKKNDLPFTGGALGYFSYDLARRIEHLPRPPNHHAPLPDMAIGIYDWVLVVDHLQQKTWLSRQHKNMTTHKQFSIPTGKKHRPFQLLDRMEGTPDYADYVQGFKKIQHYICAGDCYQVNYARFFSAPAQGDPWLLYQALRRGNPAPFSAYLNTPWGQILSTSPERFLQVKDGQVQTRPIKGTRPRHANPAVDLKLREALRQSEKDRAENLMIVDLLRNDLGKDCRPGSIHVPALFEVESFASVHHLISTVCGQLRPERYALDLLRDCFPGGSITGAPKLRAMQIIDELEPQARGIYCGAIGYCGFDGNMDTNIAIRTLQYQNSVLSFQSGGGIVADSQADDEYRETGDKAAAIMRVLY